MEVTTRARNCGQCEALHINGTLCHETGCPESWRDTVTDCNWCGSEFKPAEQGQEFCSESCAQDYHGIAAPDSVTYCDLCGDGLGDYFPGCGRCDNCTDLHGLEFEPDRLRAALVTISGGIS